MNQKNYDFLIDAMERLGFQNPAINQHLETKMKLGMNEFEIGSMKMKFGEDTMLFTAKFERGESKNANPNAQRGEEFYYLNAVKATIQPENGKSQAAEFALFNQQGFNTSQMFKLMKGRPIYKKPRNDEGRWTKVDFKNTDDNGVARVRNYFDSTTNFNMERELDKLNIPWANPQDKSNAMADLRNGEIISVSFKQDGKWEAQKVGVSPQIGSMIVYNDKMDVIKQTNTQTIEMVLGDDLSQKQNTGKKLPDQTVELMKEVNNPKKNEGQNQGRSKKAS